jgi:hypothetical protein
MRSTARVWGFGFRVLNLAGRRDDFVSTVCGLPHGAQQGRENVGAKPSIKRDEFGVMVDMTKDFPPLYLRPNLGEEQAIEGFHRYLKILSSCLQSGDLIKVQLVSETECPSLAKKSSNVDLVRG